MFVWKGKRVETWGDLGAAAAALRTQKEAAEFMALYRKENPKYADANIGYLAGYYSQKTMARILRLCRTSHPVFGTVTNLTPKQAFQKGVSLGKKGGG